MDHAQRAREWLGIVEHVSPDHINDCGAETQINALTAIGHALLDVAAAIREQTAGAKWGGIRDDLANIDDALRNTIGGRP